MTLPCLVDVVLQTHGAAGTFASYVGSGALNCQEKKASLAINDPALTLGGSVSVSGGGFAPNAPVAAVLSSKPLVLGATTADASGLAAGTFTIPSDASTGTHTLELTGFAADGTFLRLVSRVLTVRGVQTSFTYPLLAIGLGVLIVASGAWFVVHRRRRPRR